MAEESIFAQGPENRSMPQATVVPILHYADVLKASEWLCRAFGFSEHLRIGTHRIQLSVGAGAVVVAQSQHLETKPGIFYHSTMVRVQDAIGHCNAARGAGAEIVSEPSDQPFGERQYTAKDLAGHAWTFSQSLKDVDPISWGGQLASKNAG